VPHSYPGAVPLLVAASAQDLITRFGLTACRGVDGHGGTTGAQTSLKWGGKPTVLIARWGISRRGSANHLVRLEQQRRGECEPQGLSGLEIDH
jgi:hypothetical protein